MGYGSEVSARAMFANMKTSAKRRKEARVLSLKLRELR